MPSVLGRFVGIHPLPVDTAGIKIVKNQKENVLWQLGVGSLEWTTYVGNIVCSISMHNPVRMRVDLLMKPQQVSLSKCLQIPHRSIQTLSTA